MGSPSNWNQLSCGLVYLLVWAQFFWDLSTCCKWWVPFSTKSCSLEEYMFISTICVTWPLRLVARNAWTHQFDCQLEGYGCQLYAKWQPKPYDWQSNWFIPAISCHESRRMVAMNEFSSNSCHMLHSNTRGLNLMRCEKQGILAWESDNLGMRIQHVMKLPWSYRC